MLKVNFSERKFQKMILTGKEAGSMEVEVSPEHEGVKSVRTKGRIEVNGHKVRVLSKNKTALGYILSCEVPSVETEELKSEEKVQSLVIEVPSETIKVLPTVKVTRKKVNALRKRGQHISVPSYTEAIVNLEYPSRSGRNSLLHKARIENGEVTSLIGVAQSAR